MKNTPESTLNTNMSPLGSSVLNEEDLAQLERSNEMYVSELMKSVQTSQEAKVWLNTQLGKDLRKFIIDTKQSTSSRVMHPRDEDERVSAKYEYDVICGVEQFFGNMLVAGKVAGEMLQQKEEIQNA